MDKGGEVGVSRFSVEIFLSQSAENFCRGTLVGCVSECFQEQKILRIRGGEESIKLLFLRKLLVSQCRKISQGNPSVLRFRKVPLAKKLTDKRREGWKGGVSRLSVENFLSDSAEIFRWETFSVSLISSIEKVWIRGGGVGVSRFSVEYFCLTVPKFSFGKPFSVSLISGIEKVWIRGGGGGVVVSRFSVEKFLSQGAENFRRGTLVCYVSENFQERKSLSIRGGERGVSRFAVEFALSHSAEKLRARTLQCFTDFG